MQKRIDSLPKDCFLYHPLSKLKHRDGYYPNISPAQMDAYNQLKIKLKEANITMHNDGEHEFLKTLRFLRARKFHVDKTFTMIEKDVQWRNEEYRFDLPYQNIDEVMGIDYNAIYPLIPYWRQGYDKEARPVYYLPCGKWNITEAVKLCHMKKLHRHDAWNGYRMTHILLQISKKINYNVETVGAVFDVAGLGMNMLTSDFFAYVRGLAANDSDHNPERAGWVMIINAHWVFRIAWNVIQSFVDEITKSKIMILGDRSEWEPLLKRLVNSDQIPVQYGGTALDRSTAENIAVAKMTPVDESFVVDLNVDKHLHLPSSSSHSQQQQHLLNGKLTNNISNKNIISATSNSSSNSILDNGSSSSGDVINSADVAPTNHDSSKGNYSNINITVSATPSHKNSAEEDSKKIEKLTATLDDVTILEQLPSLTFQQLTQQQPSQSISAALLPQLNNNNKQGEEEEGSTLTEAEKEEYTHRIQLASIESMKMMTMMSFLEDQEEEVGKGNTKDKNSTTNDKNNNSENVKDGQMNHGNSNISKN